MAKTTSQPTQTKPATNGNQQAQFINYEMSDEERKKFKAWATDGKTDLWSLLEKLVDDGYGISAKWDEYGKCVSSFMQTKKTDSPNYGWILSGRGSSVFSAVSGVLYRHYVLFEGQWPIEQNRRGKLDDE